MIRKGNDISGAEFSERGKYRYSLWRTWTPAGLDGRLCAFIGLNPSTATHQLDDPTIRRCIRFCCDWGFDGYVMLNIFAYRATDPKVMKRQAAPIGSDNDDQILIWANRCSQVVCAWGIHGTHQGRGSQVKLLLQTDLLRVHHLGLTKAGHPKHPLYLRSDLKPIEWQ